MKIIQLTLDFAPFWFRGGPPRIMHSYAQFFRQQSVKVVTICSDQGMPELSEKYERKFTFYLKALPIPFLKSIYFNFNPFKIWILLRKEFEENCVIHLSQSRSIFNLVALFFSFFYPCRIAFSPFGSLPDRGKLSLKLFDFFITRPLVRRATFNLAQTNHEADVLKAFGASDSSITLAPLCLTKPTIPAAENIRTLRKDLTHPPLFLFLGRFHASKGVVPLLNAFVNLFRSGSPGHLIMIGVDNGEEAKLRNKVKQSELTNRIKILPPVYGEDRFNWYAAADFFIICPEIFEETSLASIEALSVGTPVITNFRSEVPFLEEYKAGFHISDDSLLEDALSKIMSNFSSKATEAKASIRLFDEVFSVEANVKALKLRFFG